MSSPDMDTSPTGIPEQGGTPRISGTVRAAGIGALVGLALGAGGMGIIWAAASTDDADGAAARAEADITALCGIIERTEPPPDSPEDITLAYAQRWTMAGVATAAARDNPDYQPLADALSEAQTAVQTMNTEALTDAADEARTQCESI